MFRFGERVSFIFEAGRTRARRWRGIVNHVNGDTVVIHRSIPGHKLVKYYINKECVESRSEGEAEDFYAALAQSLFALDCAYEKINQYELYFDAHGITQEDIHQTLKNLPGEKYWENMKSSIQDYELFTEE